MVSPFIFSLIESFISDGVNNNSVGGAITVAAIPLAVGPQDDNNAKIPVNRINFFINLLLLMLY